MDEEREAWLELSDTIDSGDETDEWLRTGGRESPQMLPIGRVATQSCTERASVALLTRLIALRIEAGLLVAKLAAGVWHAGVAGSLKRGVESLSILGAKGGNIATGLLTP